MSDAEDVRLRVYRQLADEGRVDPWPDLADELGISADELSARLAELAASRHIVLDDHGAIVLAHPFATRDFHFSVKSDRTLWWGGCAWDAFAIAHLVPGAAPVLVATTCPGCGRPHAWSVGTQHPPDGTQVAHFLVPMAHVWDDVVHTCGHQRIFCDEECVDVWLAAERREKGSVFDLETLWRLSSGWYAGRLERGYRRREPAEAKAYFRDAGLTGPFWGN